jgi:protocatechuate 3,4-dioxygenase alpha subunit
MSTDLGLSPSQTVGPYLSIGLLNDLITPSLVEPDDPRAIRLNGTLFDGRGIPVPDGMIEIWQASPSGRYDEPGFRGFARSGTVDAGRFSFVTVKPGAVPSPEGGLQAPHVLVGVFARGMLARAVTRIYFPDEIDANASDPVLARLDEAARTSLVAALEEDGSLRFDIRLQGDDHTTFFAL